MSAVQPLLEAAGIDQIHYGGGVTADLYDWQTDTDIQNCSTFGSSEFTDPTCATSDALDFSQLSSNARAIGAQTSVSVNYGTGSPALAAAWVQQAATTTGQAVSDWEIGNEGYGCWEADDELAGPPENYQGYVPNHNTTCPMVAEPTLDDGMTIMADSYAANAAQFITAMRAADPSAQIGVPWAFDLTVGGSSVQDSEEWNDTVLGQDGPDISFVDAHWYPFGFDGDAGDTDPLTGKTNPTNQTVLRSVFQVPSEYAKIQAALNTYAPDAKVIVGETGVSYLPTNLPCTPAGALFTAGDVLEWLAAGAQSVDWWQLDTDANLDYPAASCQPDEGMFSNPANPDTGSPEPLSPYTGYLLASVLAKPGAQLESLTSTNPSNVLAFQSVLPNGQVAMALINTNTSTAENVTVSTPLAGNLSTESYSAANQNASNTEIVDGTTTASAIAGGITLPAESIEILKGTPGLPSAITLGTGSSATFKAGSTVTFTGKLTLNGTAAPSGALVTISRQMSGNSKDNDTLFARTAAGGTFTFRDIPPAYGSYVYIANYASSTYVPATHTVTVHVTVAKPTLKLAVSARSVSPGKKITVTATLSAPHVNRTLYIYAQDKGHARELIAHGAVNSKGQLSAVYTARANTTFTVTFSGDTWYSSASASAAVTV